MSAWDRLAEEYGVVSFGTLDTTGVRDKGMDRPLLKRDPESPYDLPMDYGHPYAYDRGSSGHGPGHAGPPVPKDTSHSAWDDASEAMGTPMNFSMAYSSDIGNATQVPGASGWATDPPKQWDDEEDPPSLPEDFITKKDVPGPPKVSGLFGKKTKDADVMVVGSPNSFRSAPGLSLRTSRNVGGMIPKEGAWDFLESLLSGGIFDPRHS